MKKLTAFALLIFSLSSCTQEIIINPAPTNALEEKAPSMKDQILNMRSVIESFGENLTGFRDWNEDLPQIGDKERKALLSRDGWNRIDTSDKQKRWEKKVPNTNKTMIVYLDDNIAYKRYYVEQYTVSEEHSIPYATDYLSLILFEKR